MDLQIREHKELQCYVRPETSDESAFKEVIVKKNYEKYGLTIESGETWLDLGANIGTFSLYALSKGAIVAAYEPEPENCKLVKKNIKLNKFKDFTLEQSAVVAGKQQTMTLYVGDLPKNKWRHTIARQKRGASIEISCVNFADLIKDLKPDGVKMDIEGAEFDILTKHMKLFKNIPKFTFEYHFDFDRKMSTFFKFREELKKIYKTVRHKTIVETVEEYNYFPSGITLYCHNE